MSTVLRGPFWRVRFVERKRIFIELIRVVNIGDTVFFKEKEEVLARFQGVVERNETPNTVREVFLFPAALKQFAQDDLDAVRKALVGKFRIKPSQIKIVGVDIQREDFEPGFSGGVIIDPNEPGSLFFPGSGRG